jgi:cell division septation protein DedD
MPDGKTRSREQSIWLIMVWIVTLAAMVGLGVLIGKYILSYYASSLQTPRSSQALTTQQRIASSDSTQKDETPASSIATGAEQVPAQTKPQEPAAGTQTQPGITGVASGSVLYKVQVGEFYDRSEAEKVARVLEEAGYPIYITPGAPHRIQVGAFQNKANADALKEQLEAEGYSVVIQ